MRSSLVSRLLTPVVILWIVNSISKSFEFGKFTLDVFIDFSKAFDTVDPTILMNKLNQYAIKINTTTGSNVT